MFLTFTCKIADSKRQFQGEEMYKMQDDCTEFSESDIFAGGLTWKKKRLLGRLLFYVVGLIKGGGTCVEIKMNGLRKNVSGSCSECFRSISVKSVTGIHDFRPSQHTTSS